jgi:hypothetical protein
MTEISLEIMFKLSFKVFLKNFKNNFMFEDISPWFQCLHFNVYFSKYSWIYPELLKANIWNWFFDTYIYIRQRNTCFFAFWSERKYISGLTLNPLALKSVQLIFLSLVLIGGRFSFCFLIVFGVWKLSSLLGLFWRETWQVRNVWTDLSSTSQKAPFTLYVPGITDRTKIITAYWPSVRSVLGNIRLMFFSMDRATKERGPCKKQRSDISQYRPNNRGQ